MSGFLLCGGTLVDGLSTAIGFPCLKISRGVPSVAI